MNVGVRGPRDPELKRRARGENGGELKGEYPGKQATAWVETAWVVAVGGGMLK